MNTEPKKLLITSDFPSLKNDNTATGSIVIPGSLVLAGSASATAFIDVPSNANSSLSRGRIASTKNFTNWYTGQSIFFPRTGSLGSYNVVAFIWRPSAGITRFQVLIQNPFNSSLTLEAGSDTIYFYTNQFVAPYA